MNWIEENQLYLVFRDVIIYVSLFDCDIIDGFVEDIQKIYIGKKRREVDFYSLRQCHKWQIENAILSYLHNCNDGIHRYITGTSQANGKCMFFKPTKEDFA